MHGEIQIERMWTAKRQTYYQGAFKKRNKEGKKMQALLTGRHIETNAIRHSGRLQGEWAYQKSLLITKVLQETITHMDGDDTEEETERDTEFMYTTSRTHQRTWSVRSCKEWLGWEQTWHSLVFPVVSSKNNAGRSSFAVGLSKWKPHFELFLQHPFKKNHPLSALKEKFFGSLVKVLYIHDSNLLRCWYVWGLTKFAFSPRSQAFREERDDQIGR